MEVKKKQSGGIKYQIFQRLRFRFEGCGDKQVQVRLQRNTRENEAGEKEDGRSQEKLEKVTDLGFL